MATNPTLLTQPIAANGAKNVIPNTTTTTGAMSQDQGFPAETALPLGAGGVAPTREDFNGAFNLLSGILYMAQKGWVFLFDENQDYFAGCTVRDPLDSKIYEAINDVSASSTHPSADSVNWKLGTDMSAYTTTVNSPMFNKRDIITTSGTYTAPVTGWYHFHIIGGGGAGMTSASWSSGTNSSYGGGGGGAGGEKDIYTKLTAGQSVECIVGAGGLGASQRYIIGGDGGTTSITVGSNTYSVTGGKAAGTFSGLTEGASTSSSEGYACISTVGGEGGWDGSDPLTKGESGGNGSRVMSSTNTATAGNGGGRGGGLQYQTLDALPTQDNKLDATGYGGGGGGNAMSSEDVVVRAGNGYQGCIVIEYFDSTLNA